LTAAVARLDAGRRSGPWTREILEWIRDHPAVVSTELAALLGREVAPMKADIRRLKGLGLTISLPVGYQLSPRGQAYLRSLG
jgi:predicted transcriptional regulator